MQGIKNLTQGPINRQLFNLAMPIMATSFIQMAYSLTDMAWVGRLGSEAVAAIGSVGILTWMSGSISLLNKVGSEVSVGQSIGAQSQEDARSFASHNITIALIISICWGTLLFIFAEPIIRIYELEDHITANAIQYLRIVSTGLPFVFLSAAFTGIYNAAGRSKVPFFISGTGLILNIILDPIFIFGFRWGMMGAAVATVIGQLVTAVLAVWYLLHMKIIRPEKGDYRLKGSICGRTLTLGMTSFLSQISLVAAMAAINNMIRKYGALDAVFGQEQYTQIPMAVVGIVMKFFQIVISIVVGMAAGCIPVVGFNMGAKKPARVKELFTKLLLAEAAVGAVALVLVELLPRQLIALFGAANESVYYTDFAVKSFRIYLCMIILACVNKACFIFLQAMGKAAESTALSMVREVVFGVGFALLLPRFFGLDGVLYSMPMSDILTFLIAGYLICKTYRELSTKGEV